MAAELRDVLGSAKSSSVKDLFRPQIALGESRLKFLEAATNDDAEALKLLIGETITKKQKGPSKDWQSLAIYSAVEAKVAAQMSGLDAAEAVDKDVIADALKQVAIARESLANLVAAGRDAAKDLARSIADREKKMQKDAEKKGKNPKPDLTGGAPEKPPAPAPAGGKAPLKRLRPLFEIGPSQAVEISVLSDNAVAASTFLDPFVVHCDSLESGMKDSASQAFAALESFRKQWPSLSIRRTSGRGVQKMQNSFEEVEELLLHRSGCKTVVIQVPPGSTNALRAALQASITASAFGNESAYMEPYGLPTLRATVCGHRLVIMAKIADVAEVFGVSLAEQDSVSKVARLLMNATQEKITRLGSRFRSTVLRAGDILYTPAGFMVCESSGLGAGAVAGKQRDCDVPAPWDSGNEGY